jgi:hypothetical protein
MRGIACHASKGTERMHRGTRQTVPKVTRMQRPLHAREEVNTEDFAAARAVPRSIDATRLR